MVYGGCRDWGLVTSLFAQEVWSGAREADAHGMAGSDPFGNNCYGSHALGKLANRDAAGPLGQVAPPYCFGRDGNKLREQPTLGIRHGL